MTTTPPDGRRPDTRDRIQQVAVELFAEHGYDATSLREIAERLGVTKAALYYHFKSKEEIVQSLVEDQVRVVDDLVAWARDQPPGVATRREIVRRYAAELHRHRLLKFIRFLERNQTSLQRTETAVHLRDRMMELLALFRDADTPVALQVRRSLAFFALHTTALTITDPQVTDEQRQQAALEVALELVE